MAAQLVQTHRGGKALLYQGYKCLKIRDGKEPIRFVRVAWQGLKQEAPVVDHIDDFVSYFESTWLDGQFRLHQWNYFNYSGPRTNNHVEGWHSRLKRIVGKPHPNILNMWRSWTRSRQQQRWNCSWGISATKEKKIHQEGWNDFKALRTIQQRGLHLLTI